MRKINALYEMEEEANAGIPTSNWDRGTMIHKEPAIEPSIYQKYLDEGLPRPTLTTSSVRYWSDYNRVFYHPRSSVQFNEFTHNSTVTPFNTFELGKDLFHKENTEHDILDKDFRFFAEECDQMQGIQVIMTADDAWAGFGTEYIKALRDEYGKTAIVAFGLEDTARVARDKTIHRTIALARTLTTLHPAASLYVPLRSPPLNFPRYVTLDPTSPWHTSALISTAIESATLPTRLRDKEGVGMMGTLNDLSMLLNVSGNQKISMLKMRVDDREPEEDDIQIQDSRVPTWSDVVVIKRKYTGSEEIEMSWEVDKGSTRGFRGTFRGGKEHVFSRAEVHRGSTKRQEGEEEKEELELGYGDKRGPIVGRYYNSFTYPIVDSFPHIYSCIPPPPVPTTSPTGEIIEAENPRLNVATTLTSSARVLSRIRGIREIVSRMVDVDERESLGNELGEIAEGFVEGWDSGSDTDDEE
ncbi:mtDNA inheritance, partitioning of the mitochondrial organelle [Rhizina undulata]